MKLFILVTAVLVSGLGLSYGTLRWLNDRAELQAVPATPQAQARRLAETRGCLACHSLDGKRGIGPSWQGSWGMSRRFTDGGEAIVDAAYLREAMQQPALRIVEGYDNVMLPTGFTEAELQLITDFIESLGTGTDAG